MVAFEVFGYPIYWYGIFYAVTMLVVYGYLHWMSRQKVFAPHSTVQHILETGKEDFLLLGVLGVLIGGRLGHVLIYDFSYYVVHPLKVFAIHEGGMSFIGGILGVASGMFLFAKIKKLTRSELGQLVGVLVSIMPFGSMIGRIGNFLNQELYGRAVTEVFGQLSTHTIAFLQRIYFFHIYDHVDQVLRINTNFLASFLEGFVLLVIMQWLFRHKQVRGWTLGLLWLMGYSVVRFLLEYVRQDSQAEFIGWFSKSQWFFLIFIIVCGVLWWMQTKKKQ